MMLLLMMLVVVVVLVEEATICGGVNCTRKMSNGYVKWNLYCLKNSQATTILRRLPFAKYLSRFFNTKLVPVNY